VREVYSLIDQSTEKLAAELDRQPTVEEIAELSGVSAERVALVHQHRRPLVSLSTPLDMDGDSELGDLIADEGAISPFESAAAALEKRALIQQLRRLEEREEEVLRARFGIENESARSNLVHSASCVIRAFRACGTKANAQPTRSNLPIKQFYNGTL
jgi:RNA polymerase primary sigma factor